MNQSKKKVLAVLMVASMAIPTGMAPVSDAAKKVKFNKTNITVKVGKKAKVTLKNAAKKAPRQIFSPLFGRFRLTLIR